MTESGLDENGVPYWMSAARFAPSQFPPGTRCVEHIDLAEVKRIELGQRDDTVFDNDREGSGVAR